MLKIAITLCLLATCSSLRVTELIEGDYLGETIDPYLTYIQQTTTEIQLQLDKIMVENMQFYSKAVMKLDLIQKAARVYLSDRLDKELNRTRANVDAASAQGKDAEYCFQSGEREQDIIKTTASKKLRHCFEHSIQKYVDGFCFAKNLFKDGDTAIKHLGSISSFCFSKTCNVGNCFESEVANAKFYVRRFYGEYNKRQNNRKEVYKNIEIYSFLCLGKVVNDTNKQIAEWVFFTDSCLEGAE